MALTRHYCNFSKKMFTLYIKHSNFPYCTASKNVVPATGDTPTKQPTTALGVIRPSIRRAGTMMRPCSYCYCSMFIILIIDIDSFLIVGVDSIINIGATATVSTTGVAGDNRPMGEFELIWRWP